jgi:hypothetical protein
MKLRYLKKYGTFTGVETCGWMKFLPFFGDKKITYTSYSYKLQVLENDEWIDVPTVVTDERNENTK